VLLAVALLATAGCTVGPSDRPAVAVRDTDLPPHRPQVSEPGIPPVPPLGEYNPNSLGWRDCTNEVAAQLGGPGPAQVDCAVVRVNSDVSQPAFGDSLKLDLTRIGHGPAPLVVVTEATEEPGTVRAARLAGQLPPALLKSFTLIGLARRGTGTSQPLDCVPASTRSEIVGVDPDVRAPGQLDSLLDTIRTAIQTCVQDLGEVLTAINSPGTADDLEVLRARLNAPVLNILAHGTASRAVTDFIRRYPTSVGRVVLDGAADPVTDAVAGTEATITAADAGYAAFAADCVARDCPWGADPRAALLRLADQLRQSPLQAGHDEITAGTAFQAVLETIGSPERWGELSQALADARNGDGSGIAALVAPALVATRGLPARFDPALATHCNDTATRVPPERAAQLVTQWRQRSPLFGPLFAQRMLLCSAWPVPARPPVAPVQRTLPPVLILATAQDPLTPADGARRTADSLPSAMLATWQGQAHGALPRSSCMVDLVTRFLVDAATPPPGTLCPP
jgi:pimeloyl-ACP methyl ester carboxylesterase